QEQLDFANFKEGSYWIMRDSITGQIDSLVLDEDTYYLSPDNNESDCPDFYEVKQLRIVSYPSNIKIVLNFVGGRPIFDIWNSKSYDMGTLYSTKESFTYQLFSNIYTECYSVYKKTDSMRESYTIV